MSLIDLCPSSTHRAALRLTGIAVGGPVSDAVLCDLAQADPVKLAGIANVNFVHTLLSRAQGRDDRLDAAVPDDLWLYFREMADANVQRLAHGRNQLQRIGAALAAKGLSGVLMKGGVQMLEPAGFDMEHRFLNDFDILFSKTDAPRAHACLAEMGGTFEPYPVHEAENHHLPQLHFADPDNVVEVHDAVGAPRIAQVLSVENYIARAHPSSLPGLMLPHPQDRYLHHILHSADGRHDQHLIFLRSILDHVAYQKATSDVDKAAAKRQLEQAGLSGDLAVLSALTDLALGYENSAAVAAQTKWLKKALPLFARPGQRRMRMATRSVARIFYTFITSASERKRMLGLLKEEGLRSRLRLHRDQMSKHR